MQYFPPLIALLNFISLFLLLWGRVKIKQGERDIHKRIMLSALTVSAIFLVVYLIYHARVGSVGYPLYDWTRTIYFIILIPHIILAGVMVPFILMVVGFALRGRFEAHRKLVRWVWPVWVYVSVSGVLVYLMLYLYAGAVPV